MGYFSEIVSKFVELGIESCRCRHILDTYSRVLWRDPGVCFIQGRAQLASEKFMDTHCWMDFGFRNSIYLICSTCSPRGCLPCIPAAYQSFRSYRHKVGETRDQSDDLDPHFHKLDAGM